MNTYTFQVQGTPHAEGLPMGVEAKASSLPAAFHRLGTQIDKPARRVLIRYGGTVTIRLTGITKTEVNNGNRPKNTDQATCR